MSAGLLALLAGLVYANSFTAPFVLDDERSVTQNAGIHRLWPPGEWVAPDAHSPLAGRPLASLTFALNHAFGGTAVASYHSVNFAIHLAAGLALWGVVRRTLARVAATPAGAEHRRDGETRASERLAWLIAALWIVHPLLTGTVTYVSQRTEALMGLCYLLTLYAFIRGVETGLRRWLAGAVAGCALGMASKEVMVTAPVLVALYDRVFVAGSWREVARRRGKFYLALASTWLLLAGLMNTGAGPRPVGFDAGVAGWDYAQTQCVAVLRYLGLTLWPQTLVFDYGPVFFTGARAVPAALGLAVLLGFGGWILGRWKRIGFLVAGFFLLLAPTSSVVPVAGQPIAENRAYLPSIALVTLLVLGVHAAVGRRAWVPLVALGLAAGALAHHRNETYRRATTLWTDTIAKWPMNPRAYNNLGKLFLESGDHARATRLFEQALQVNPGWVDALINLGAAESLRGNQEQAVALRRRAVERAPQHAPAHFELANSLYLTGRVDEAVASYEMVLRLWPDHPETLRNLGAIFSDRGRLPEGLALLERSARLRPDLAATHFVLGLTFERLGRGPEAARSYERALQLNPGLNQARENLMRLRAQLKAAATKN